MAISAPKTHRNQNNVPWESLATARHKSCRTLLGTTGCDALVHVFIGINPYYLPSTKHSSRPWGHFSENHIQDAWPPQRAGQYQGRAKERSACRPGVGFKFPRDSDLWVRGTIWEKNEIPFPLGSPCSIQSHGSTGETLSRFIFKIWTWKSRYHWTTAEGKTRTQATPHSRLPPSLTGVTLEWHAFSRNLRFPSARCGL